MTMCCPYNQVCCNEGCCPAGQICCGNECCKPAKCCNNECCGSNEICCNGFCQTTDCSISLDPDMVCPGGSVELQGLATCNPECATMSLTAEIVEPAMQALASVSVSPGSIPCGPFKTPFTVTVTVSADAAPGTFTVKVTGKIIDGGEVACETTTQATVTIDECVNLTFQSVANNEETNPGGFLCVNGDDDNDSSVPDKDEPGPTINEDDLKSLTISLSGGWTGSGMVTVSCEAGCSRVRFYENPDRTNPIGLPLMWTVPTPQLPKTLYVEGFAVSAAPRDVELKGLFEGEGGPCEDHVKLTIIQVDVDVDTDRNAVVDQGDDGREDDWVADRGAIFMVNYDDDDGNSQPDAINFTSMGQPTGEDTDIDNAADTADIASLILRATGPTENVQFFFRMAADDLKAVHLFRERLAGEAIIWGGWGAHGGESGVKERDITTVVRPTTDLDVGIESLFFRGQNHNLPGGGMYEFDGEVDVELVAQQTVGATAIVPGKIICTDKVRLKVAPYMMLPNTQDATEVWMIDNPGSDDIAAMFGAVARRAIPSGNQWFQDHVQIGYTAFPGQTVHETMRMPYGSQDAWPTVYLSGPGRGIYRLRNTVAHDGAGSGDFGGNLEVVPPSDDWPLGRITYGNTMGSRLPDFLRSQELAGPVAVQEPFEIDVDWLAVGHVDEIVGFLPGGTRGFKVAVASPVYAQQLLTMGDPARGITPPSDDTALFAVGAQASGTASNSITTDSKVYLFDGVAHGVIKVVSGVALSDGELVTVSDGSVSRTFEFNKSGGVMPGNVAVTIMDVMNTQAVRDALLGTINGAGLSVDAVPDDPPLGTPDKLIIINRNFGFAGNVSITETVGPAGFTVQGMAGGEATSNGRDFTTTTWQFIRIYDGSGSGQVGAIQGRAKGWITVKPPAPTIKTVFNTTSRIAWDRSVTPNIDGLYRFISGNADAPRERFWFAEPNGTSSYLVVAESLKWFDSTGEFPAVVSVKEVKADTALWSINMAAHARISGVATVIQTAMGFASGGGFYLRNDGNDADDSLVADLDDEFVIVPVIYLGEWIGALSSRKNVAFIPGLANVQPSNAATIVFPKPFGPMSAGSDVLENATLLIIGAGSRFADDWNLYHRLDGEVHCATEVVRVIFPFKSPCAIRSRVFIGFTRQPSGGSWCDRGCAAG